jgi:glutaredoxin
MKKILYGIPNCDTVKKARTWLAENGQEFEFHDFKKQGLSRETVAGLARTAGLGSPRQPQGHDLAQAVRTSAARKSSTRPARWS